MDNHPRLALLEAANETDRILNLLVKEHRDSHNAVETGIRAMAKQIRVMIKHLNSPPILKDRSNA